MTTVFGPRAMVVARFLIEALATTLVGLLDEVAAAFPDLPFDDFRGAWILFDLLVRYPDRIHPMAKGLSPPGDDPIQWLDELIELAAPARGRA
jgi:hypothetical protein